MAIKIKNSNWITGTSAKRLACLLPLVASIFMWLPAINIPFWQDDYFYIYNAKNAVLAGDPFWISLWPKDAPSSWNWRPLSQEMYWRFVVEVLDADSKLAHMFNILLLYMAAFFFGQFAYIYSKLAKWPEPTWVALLCSGLYAIAQFNFLPVYWVSAANGSILSALTFLALSTFLRFQQAESVKNGALLGLLLFAISTISLLVKESAILMPCLCFLVWVSLGFRWRYGGLSLGLLLSFFVTAAIWWVLRSSFVLPTPPEYGLQFSMNVIRNLVAQIAWIINVPRESIRLLTIGQFGLASLWILFTAAPVLTAVLYVRTSSHGLFGIRILSTAIFFAVVAYAPYYFLAWNSYEYYVAISTTLLLVLLSRGIVATPMPLIPVLLAVVSSFFGVIGNQLVDYPALIARAEWGEMTLVALEKASVKLPITVNVLDEHRFGAIRQDGLALRLKVPLDQIRFSDKCGVESLQMLVVDIAGKVWLEDCLAHSKMLIVSP